MKTFFTFVAVAAAAGGLSTLFWWLAEMWRDLHRRPILCRAVRDDFLNELQWIYDSTTKTEEGEQVYELCVCGRLYYPDERCGGYRVYIPNHGFKTFASEYAALEHASKYCKTGDM